MLNFSYPVSRYSPQVHHPAIPITKELPISVIITHFGTDMTKPLQNGGILVSWGNSP